MFVLCVNFNLTVLYVNSLGFDLEIGIIDYVFFFCCRQVLSYWTCSKLCAIFFVGGVVFGYTLRGRVKRWASKILKKLS